MDGWEEAWFAAAAPLRADLWRAVEAQHRIATMRLADSAAEQAVLERLLEASKPPLPPAARGMSYLLNTPFRYLSPWPSRFRPAGAPGAWYGAEQIATACAEVGYWRWRFLMDSEGLRDGKLFVEFTVFQARVDGRAIDLAAHPWLAAQASWMHAADYSACHALAAAAREHRIDWVRYLSVRDPEHGVCGAVFDVDALSLPVPTLQQTWAARVQRNCVIFCHDDATLEFRAEPWTAAPTDPAAQG